MNKENSDHTIADIHRIRREIAAKFNGDLFAMTADAQARSEASERQIIRKHKKPVTAAHPADGSEATPAGHPVPNG
ncbi:MAG: hypothetical protein ACKVP0_01665 [Pirellulaceae bacterium]